MEKPSWKWRRLVVFGALSLIGVLLVYLTIWAPDDELRRTLAAGLMFLASGIIGSYVFGAVWDDANVMRYRPGARE